MKKNLITVLALLLTTTLFVTNATAQEKITGPWLWMIAPTEPGLGGAASIDIDSLAVASGGAVTEADIAANGARAGDFVGNYAWTFGEISATGGDNINECLNQIGMTNGNVDDHSSYALFQFQADTAQHGVTMRVGSDDAIKVWLNGAVVHNHPVDRGASDFQDTFGVNVVAGENLLLVKVSERGGGWSMFVGMDTAAAPIRVSIVDPPIQVPVQAEVSIPDANLAAAIRETLGLPPGAPLTTHAMLALTRLKARNRGISDLTGLEHAVNLIEVDLEEEYISGEGYVNSNAIFNVSPLGKLTQLKGLNLTGMSGLSDISALARLTQLKWLFLGSTGVSDVSALAHLTQLARLTLYHTGVSDVSALAHLTKLEWLSLGWTGVSDVSALAHLTKLVTLDLWGTGVSDVSALARLTNLEQLDLRDTAVSDVSALARLTNLEQLDLKDCPLNAAAHQTHIPAIQANGTAVEFDPFKPIHLPGVPSLVSLIYFRPSDRPVRPDVDATIDGLIKEAQRFFADEMERHGFGRKTFQFETDAHGNAVVHHVNGKFPNAHYQQNYDSWKDEIGEQIYIPKRSITAYMLDSDPDGRSFTEFGGYGGGSPYGGGWAAIDSQLRDWVIIAHELGHAFGMLEHDHRDLSLMSYRGFDGSLSPCFAAWLDVHPAFNPTVVPRNTPATIQMLPATLAVPPNAIRLRFTVTAPAGSLYQARLLTPEKWTRDGYAFNSGGLIGCKRIDGNPTSSTVEFVTALTPDTKSVTLDIIGIDGDIVRGGSFPIDVASLLPPAKVVSIPDPNLAAAVREALNMSAGEPVTTHSILNLVKLEARNRGIKSLTGLEHAVNLKAVDLGEEYISGEGYVNSNAISDFSPLERLTVLELNLARMSGLRDVSALASLINLETLDLNFTDVSDVSALARLTQLKWLSLSGTDVSDVSVLARLTQLNTLHLGGTDVSDVSALARLTNLETLDLWGTGVSDVSALARLTQLKWLSLSGTGLSGTGVSDVSALARLTNLETLDLGWTGVSDVSALARLTKLETLWLRYTDVSDVSPLLGLSLSGGYWDSIGLHLQGCPLSYASIHTHIPALQAQGIEVEFDNVAHPALLKVSGDRQEGEPGAMLKTAFVVEAMDERGRPIVGKTVGFSVLKGEGTLSAKTVETDAQGKARVTFTLGWYPAVNKVKASSEGIQSWVLFTAVATEEVPQLVADVNGDGVVNIQDLVLVAGQFGKTGEHRADVNGDGVVNIQDLVLVAGAFGAGAAAPSVRAVSRARLTVSDVEGWLNEARAVSSVGQDRLILTSFSRQTRILNGSGSGDPELQSGEASRPGGLSYGRGIVVLEQLLANLMPKETVLLANYPNPFNPETWIPYQLSKPAEVTVTIYAANGAVVRRLDLGHRRAESYESRHRAAYWDGRNAQGEPVASGVYFYTLSAGDFSATRKMVIRK